MYSVMDGISFLKLLIEWNVPFLVKLRQNMYTLWKSIRANNTNNDKLICFFVYFGTSLKLGAGVELLENSKLNCSNSCLSLWAIGELYPGLPQKLVCQNLENKPNCLHQLALPFRKPRTNRETFFVVFGVLFFFFEESLFSLPTKSWLDT